MSIQEIVRITPLVPDFSTSVDGFRRLSRTLVTKCAERSGPGPVCLAKQSRTSVSSVLLFYESDGVGDTQSPKEPSTDFKIHHDNLRSPDRLVLFVSQTQSENPSLEPLQRNIEHWNPFNKLDRFRVTGMDI